MLSAALSVLHALTYLIVAATLWGMYSHYYAHLMGRGTEGLCHKWQRMTWTQAVGLQSPHSYALCWAIDHSWQLLPFPKLTVAPHWLKPRASSLVIPIPPPCHPGSHPSQLDLVYFLLHWLPPGTRSWDWSQTGLFYPLAIATFWASVFSSVQQVNGKGKHGTLPSFSPLSNFYTSFKDNSKGFLLQEVFPDFSSP